MSHSFSIKNRKPLFRKMKIMSVEELLNLQVDLVVFNLTDDPDEFDELIAQPLDQFECVLFGKLEQSARGFELSYSPEQQSYNIRILTPSSYMDWEIALDFINCLAKYLKADFIIGENNDKYAINNINYDFKQDIRFGLATLEKNISEHGDATVHGINRPVYLNTEMLNKINQTIDPIAEFSHLITEIQYLDAYSANQRFYEKENQIVATYTLTQELATILPYEPFVEYYNSLSLGDIEISDWIINLVCFEDENNGDTYSIFASLNYADFIKHLPQEKYRFIDAQYILIEPLNKSDFEKIANQAKH